MQLIFSFLSSSILLLLFFTSLPLTIQFHQFSQGDDAFAYIQFNSRDTNTEKVQMGAKSLFLFLPLNGHKHTPTHMHIHVRNR